MCDSQLNEKNFEGLMKLLGLAARAGKLVYGTPMVCEALKKGKKVYYVFRAEGASENTRKRLNDKCLYYKVALVDLPLDTVQLARRFGKDGDLAAVALTDASFAEGIKKLL